MTSRLLKAGILSLWLTLAAITPAEARPISYPGGWTSMTMNDGERNMLHLNYTFTPSFSLGYNAEYWREDQFQLHALQMNNLLKRWNNPGSQANLYLQSGIGAAYSDKRPFDRDWQPAGFTGIAADWENRRFYTSYENRYTWAGDFHASFMQQARVGVAPYIGGYGDLHTWFILQVSHTPEADDRLTVTPIVRLFKGDHLAEAGISNHGDVTFNWTIRF
ncbi:MAG: hypothetical protein Q8K65_06090 [Alphaproteobacteria bacterium]|nr:hypothetical protein [Alphaproteobacteria bacterium]